MNDMRKLLNELADEPWGMDDDGPDHGRDARRLGKKLLAQLAEYGKNGLPEVYAEAGEYLHDMYPDLPWDPEGTLIALEWMLQRPELKQINKDWIENIGFNIQAELQGAWRETNELLQDGDRE